MVSTLLLDADDEGFELPWPQADSTMRKRASREKTTIFDVLAFPDERARFGDMGNLLKK